MKYHDIVFKSVSNNLWPHKDGQIKSIQMVPTWLLLGILVLKRYHVQHASEVRHGHSTRLYSIKKRAFHDSTSDTVLQLITLYIDYNR